MIRCIVAIDNQRGLADDHGIPWRGKLPTDVAYFRKQTIHSQVLMGYQTYEEFDKPLAERVNYVATSHHDKLRDGFELVTDAREFLQQTSEDIWVIGGAGLFAQTLDLVDELYVTCLQADFHCTKFFPSYESDFQPIEQGEWQTENNITFRFEIWRRRSQ